MNKLAPPRSACGVLAGRAGPAARPFGRHKRQAVCVRPQQIGWVIVGGMSLGTLLTIFVVPTVYTLLARRRVPGEITTPDSPEGHAEVVPAK